MSAIPAFTENPIRSPELQFRSSKGSKHEPQNQGSIHLVDRGTGESRGVIFEFPLQFDRRQRRRAAISKDVVTVYDFRDIEGYMPFYGFQGDAIRYTTRREKRNGVEKDWHSVDDAHVVIVHNLQHLSEEGITREAVRAKAALRANQGVYAITLYDTPHPDRLSASTAERILHANFGDAISSTSFLFGRRGNIQQGRALVFSPKR